MRPIDAALQYASLGWRVVPIKPGDKRPPMTSWQHAATSETKSISNWWGGLYRNAGVGICTGPESGIWVLDVDTYGKDGEVALAALEAEHGKLPPTVEAATGGGGRHLFFAYPKLAPGHHIGTAGGRPGVGLDVRGDGGQVLAYPTKHATKACKQCQAGLTHPLADYTWRPGHEPGVMPVAQTPAWLLDLVTIKPATPATPPTPSKSTTPSSANQDVNPDSIAEWLKRTHTWSELLTLDGWTRAGGNQDQENWTRPGKDSGTSAVLHNAGAGPLVVFTTSVPQLQQADCRTANGDSWTFSLFGYVAATRHNGDRSACARAYRNQLNADAVRSTTYQAAQQAHQVLDQDETPDDDDWAAIDLASLVEQLQAGEIAPTLPEIMQVEGSMPLLYRARINSFFGEGGGGKSWLAAAASVEVIESDGRVCVIDWEDSPLGWAERLNLLGVDLAHVGRLDYRNPTTSLALGVERLLAQLHTYDLIVIDSTGEAMAAAGINGNDDAEVAVWFSLVKKLTRLPGAPAILIIDHIPKAEDAPKGFAIGSQRKKAAITGASYRIDTIREPAKGRNGQFKMTTAKDRLGSRAKNSVACLVDLTSSETHVHLRFHQTDAQVAEAAGVPFRPTTLMQRVSEYLEGVGVVGATQRNVIKDVTGKSSGIRSALEALTTEKYIALTVTASGSQYHSITPYRTNDDPATQPGSPPPTPADTQEYEPEEPF